MIKSINFLIIALIVSACCNTLFLHRFNESQYKQLSADELTQLAIDNLGNPITLRRSLVWNESKISHPDVDRDQYVFWNSEYEFLFPADAITYNKGKYFVQGELTPVSGGIHQGVQSFAFIRERLVNP